MELHTFHLTKSIQAKLSIQLIPALRGTGILEKHRIIETDIYID